MYRLCTVLVMCCAMSLLFLNSQSVYAQVANSRNGVKAELLRFIGVFETRSEWR